MCDLDKTSTEPEVQHLDHSLGFLINALARMMMNELDGRLQESGLTPTTWSVLMALGEEDGLPQTELSRRTFLDGATMTRALDILESRDFIKRERDELDRRVQIVTLTSAGREVYPVFARYGMNVNDEAAQVLTPGERDCIEGCVRRLLGSFHKPSNNEGKP